MKPPSTRRGLLRERGVVVTDSNERVESDLPLVIGIVVVLVAATAALVVGVVRVVSRFVGA